MRELVMFWRMGGIKLLPYLDDFMAMKSGFWPCVRMARRMDRDFVLAGLRINVPKSRSRRNNADNLDFTWTSRKASSKSPPIDGRLSVSRQIHY